MSNWSFSGNSIDSTVLLLALPLPILALFNWRSVFKAVDLNELLSLALISVICIGVYLMPNLSAGGVSVALLEAGDFHQYISWPSWLQLHSIRDPNNFHVASGSWNSIDANIEDLQRNSIRLGSTFLFAFIGSAFRSSVVNLYSIYAALLVSLMAFGVFIFSSSLVKKKSAIPFAVALLYGLAPSTQWSAYAAFLPMLMGLAINLVVFAALLPLQDLLSGDRPDMRQIFTGEYSVVWRAILLFFSWITYPEAFPLLAAILFFLTLLSIKPALIGDRIKAKNFIRAYAIYVLSLGVFLVLLSPLNFVWGVNGLIRMMEGYPHGGPQVATPLNIIAAMLGLATMPLEPRLLAESTGLPVILPGLALALAGLVYMLRKGGANRAIAAATLLAGALLFFFVWHRYSRVRLPTEAETHALITWNYLKAAQYLSPFVFTIALSGLLSYLAQTKAAVKTILSALLIGVFLVVFMENEQRFLREMTYVDGKEALLAEVNKIPGRLLLDLEMTNRYERYVFYSALADRSLISTSDHPFPCQNSGEEKAVPCENNKFMEMPFSLVLTEASNPEYKGAELYRDARHKLIDVRSSTFTFKAPDYSGQARYFISKDGDGDGHDRMFLYNLLGETVSVSYMGRNYRAAASQRPFESIEFGNDVKLKRGLSQIYVDTRADNLEISIESEDKTPGPHLSFQSNLLNAALEAIPSVDSRGNKLAVDKLGDGLRLALRQPGDSRVRLALDLDPGVYFVKFKLGDVDLGKTPETNGRAGFFGKENDRAGSFEMMGKGGREFYYRFVHEGKNRSTVPFSLGIGGWGEAVGSIVIKEMSLYRSTESQHGHDRLN
jgi:hypothetical protein